MASAIFAGNQAGAVVADIGQYAAKIGWAGHDYPKSYFRSNVAVLREDSKEEKRKAIKDVKYDYYSKPIVDGSDGDWEIANPVNRPTGLWYDPQPYSNGADWYDLTTTFIKHGYKSALHVPIEDHPIILVERSYNPPPIRQQALECLFEELNVPAAFIGKDAALACYATGRTSATVVDIGYSGTTVTPVFEGYVEQKGILRSPIGCKQMDELILQNIDAIKGRQVMPLYQVRRSKPRAEPFHHAARLQLALEIRETGAGAAVNTAPGTPGFQAPNKPFELPDGSIVDVPSPQRFAVADLILGNDERSAQKREEILSIQKKELEEMISAAMTRDADKEKFSDAAAVGLSKRKVKQSKKEKSVFQNHHLQQACSSHLQGFMEQLTANPVANMVCDSAYRCDRDQQAVLLGNVVLGGGGACLGPTDQAIPDVLREQIEAIIHTHTPGWRVKLLSPDIPERSVLSWIGGSILGSMGTFHEMWISREEYDEWGSAIVNRKCP